MLSTFIYIAVNSGPALPECEPQNLHTQIFSEQFASLVLCMTTAF